MEIKHLMNWLVRAIFPKYTYLHSKAYFTKT